MPLPFIRERRLWGEASNQDYDGALMNTADVEPMVTAAK